VESAQILSLNDKASMLQRLLPYTARKAAIVDISLSRELQDVMRDTYHFAKAHEEKRAWARARLTYTLFFMYRHEIQQLSPDATVHIRSLFLNRELSHINFLISTFDSWCGTWPTLLHTAYSKLESPKRHYSGAISPSMESGMYETSQLMWMWT
jgi:hypothetical protein